MFRRKTWIEVKRIFTPPNRSSSLKNASEDLVRKVVFGFTTIEMKCNETGEIRHVAAYGDQTGKMDD